MDAKRLRQFLDSEQKAAFSGWDFSRINDTGRVDASPLEWSYTSKVLMELGPTHSLLDMGTGGGEYLSKLQPLPNDTCATEGYEPNVPVAQERLTPLGVDVQPIGDDNRLPFEADRFDLVINKHEEYRVDEVKRVLKPDGLFITQQVGGLNELDLNEKLNANPDFGMNHWDLDYAVNELEQGGLRVIEKKEAYPSSRFYDVGALVYYLKAIPWQIPDFSVEAYWQELKQVHKQIDREGFIDFTAHRFFIVAVKD